MVYVRYLLFLKITILLPIFCKSHPYVPEMEIKDRCYMMNKQTNQPCPRDNDPIELHFKPGNLTGSVIADFPLAPSKCLQDAYTIELLFYKVKNESDTCMETSPAISHSQRKLTILRCDVNCTDVCREYGRVQFFNVVPGCYKAKVKQYTMQQYYKDRLTNWTYIGGPESETRNMKVDMEVIVPYNHGLNISMTFSKPTSYVIIELMNDQTLEKMDMVKLLANEGCHFLKSDTNSGHITKYDGLSCLFSSLSVNHSLVKVFAFKDEQCDDEMKYEPRSYHKKRACWEIQTRAVPSPREQLKVYNWNSFGIILSSFFMVLIVGCIILNLLLKRRKSRSVPNKGESALLAQDTLSRDYEILLLYARDCKEFMVTMESFRKMLGELCNVKMNRVESDAIVDILRAETERLKEIKGLLQNCGITGNPSQTL